MSANVETVLRALDALQAHNTTPADRKQAEQWLLAFQKSDDCWAIAKQLLQDNSKSADVQLFAAQTLKNKAKISRTSQDLCRNLQGDLLHLLQQLPNAPPKATAQLCLALVSVTLPLLDGLQGFLGHVCQTLPLKTSLMLMELLADEANNLMPFGPGKEKGC